MSVLNRLQNNQPAAKAGSKSYNTFGLVLEVQTVKEVDGQLRIVGNAVNTNSHIKTGEPLEVTFRGDNAGKSVTNFDKGNGKAWRKNEAACAGSIVTLESCYLTNETDGNAKVVSARWLNTLRNINRDEHEDRAALEGVLATAPRVYFENPNPQANEPLKITLPVVGDKSWGRVTNEHGTFRREFPAAFAIDKLKALPADAKVRVHIEVAEPKEAIKFSSKEELVAALRMQLGRGTEAITLLRASDGESMITRSVHVGFKKVGDEYLPDVDKAVTELFGNNLFSGVENTDALFEAAKNGELTMEAIPVYRLSFAGNASQDDNASYKVVSDLKLGRTQRFEMIFGDQGDRYAAVILPGMVRGNGEGIASFQPINLIGDEHGTFGVNEFATPHIAPGAKASPAIVPLEDADPSQARTPADVEQDFDKAMSAPQSEESAPAPAM